MSKFFQGDLGIFLLYFLLASGFSFLIYSIILRFATTLGIRESKEQPVRWAKTQKPALGGITFYIVFLFSIVFFPIFFRNEPLELSRQHIGFIGASTLAFLMGLADDAYDTRPWLKLFVQILCGVILTTSGTIITLTDNIYLDHMITILWVVGMMNSINMLDNMDAISTVVTLCILLYAFAYLYIRVDTPNMFMFILVGIIASLFAFLYFNWYPSKMFMGDTGSQLLGIFIAVAGINSCFESVNMAGESSTTVQLVVTALVFCIPFTDTATVIINRLRRKRSPFVGGRDHTTHSLFFKGVTERRIAALFTILSLMGGSLAISLLSLESFSYMTAFVYGSYFLLIFFTLYILNRITIR